MQTTREEAARLSETVTRVLDAARRGQARAFDPVRVGVLTVAADRGPLRAGAIAEELDVLPSSVTRHVQALQDAGLVATRTDPADKRASLIEATEAGREQAARFREAGAEVFHGVIADWPAQDVVRLTELLERLIASWAAKGAQEQKANRSGKRFDWSEG
ncbi:MarR family winged helix-turn-helix transcriptional regulator [Actinorhabdospora filicis]|nr:MarR family winged helix-turn-helix transcriptional regulator [Actinorhabdospora filicis]